MTNEYTTMIEETYPSYMKDKWIEYRQSLERELRKAKVKIVELEKKEQKELHGIFSKVGADETT